MKLVWSVSALTSSMHLAYKEEELRNKIRVYELERQDWSELKEEVVDICLLGIGPDTWDHSQFQSILLALLLQLKKWKWKWKWKFRLIWEASCSVVRLVLRICSNTTSDFKLIKYIVTELIIFSINIKRKKLFSINIKALG